MRGDYCVGSWCAVVSSCRGYGAAHGAEDGITFHAAEPTLGPTTSAEAAGDVILSGFFFRVGEDSFSGVDLDETTGLSLSLQVKEGGLIRDTGSLLHVVGHDHHGEALLELTDKILDG